jgi:hypothetical protein
MNKEKQRIAIAEACGIVGPFDNRWIKEYEEEGGDAYGFTGFEKGELVFIPDYLNDLNAMHEAEKTLSDEQIARWQRDLWLTCENDFYALEACAPPIVLRRFISATAAQRAEAFLRTIGKWEDDK